MENMYSYLSDSTLAHDFGLLSLEDDDYLWLYENAMPPVYSTSTLKDNLKKLGYVDLDSPSKINIYASTFEDKDAIADAIERYNDSVSEDDKIEYTDIVALLMSSISTIINVISYVLIAFVAISLVVSSIMIGIITYISVLERTKGDRHPPCDRRVEARCVPRVQCRDLHHRPYCRPYRYRRDAVAEYTDQYNRP